jgi:hypothetical protein
MPYRATPFLGSVVEIDSSRTVTEKQNEPPNPIDSEKIFKILQIRYCIFLRLVL